MVEAETPEPGPGSAGQPVSRWLGLPALAGTYAYRFNGYSVTQTRPFYLLGVGRFHLDERGTITGEHRASTAAIVGQDATVMNGEYMLTGTMSVTLDGAGDATIVFQKKNGQGLDVVGSFFVQVAGSVDRIWMISSKAFTVDADAVKIGPEAVELASLEAVRMSLPRR